MRRKRRLEIELRELKEREAQFERLVQTGVRKGKFVDLLAYTLADIRTDIYEIEKELQVL